jgi:acetolactate decarboxylase
VIANQTVFSYQDTAGTMIGIYSPGMIGTLDSPGFHFHFLSDDRTKGGHVLDWESPAVTVELDLKGNVTVDMLPY